MPELEQNEHYNKVACKFGFHFVSVVLFLLPSVSEGPAAVEGDAPIMLELCSLWFWLCFHYITKIFK
jgi:hypothetical protein